MDEIKELKTEISRLNDRVSHLESNVPKIDLSGIEIQLGNLVDKIEGNTSVLELWLNNIRSVIGDVEVAINNK